MLLQSAASLPLVRAASDDSVRLAQGVPITITGQIDENSQVIDDFRRLNAHVFEGQAGEIIRIDLVSDDFDASLILLGPNDEELGFNLDGGDGTNARIVIELPTTGTYAVGSISDGADAFSSYTLTWQAGSDSELAQYAILQRSDTLYAQASELYNQGLYEDAENIYLESLSLRKEYSQIEDPRLASILHDLANLYAVQGRLSDAEAFINESRAIRTRQLGADHFTVAFSLSILGNVYRLQGRYINAENTLLESIRILRSQTHDFELDIAQILTSLATVYQDQGRDLEALPFLAESIGIYEKYPEIECYCLFASLNNLGGVYFNLGMYESAENVYLESLRVARDQFGENHYYLAAIFNGLAELDLLQGNYSAAEQLYQKALEISEKTLGRNHPQNTTFLYNLATLYQEQGRLNQATEYLERGLQIEEQSFALNILSLTDSQRQAYSTTLASSTVYSIALSLHTSAAVSIGLTTVLQRKGRLLDVGIDSRQRLIQNLTLEDQELLDKLITTQQNLATLRFNPPIDLASTGYLSELYRLQATTEDLEKSLAQRSALFQSESQPVSLDGVEAKIPSSGVLVEYVLYKPLNDLSNIFNVGAPRYAAYLLFPDGRIEAIDLGDAAEIDAAVQSFVRLLQDRNADFQRSSGARPTTRRDVVETVTTDLKGRCCINIMS